MDNFVHLEGNLTRDPELRFTKSGTPVANFSVASNRSWFDEATRERKEQVTFIDVECWKGLAENLRDSAKKGTRVTVDGRLEQRTWETEDGQKRSKHVVVAQSVNLSLRWASGTVERATASATAGSDQEPAVEDGEEPF
jgi:single-strand DNA-binding protein